jgi:hypothetical protein
MEYQRVQGANIDFILAGMGDFGSSQEEIFVQDRRCRRSWNKSLFVKYREYSRSVEILCYKE